MVMFLVITLLLIISVIIMFYMLKKTCKELNKKSKQYFTKKGQEYLDDIKVEKEETTQNEDTKNEDNEKKETFVCLNNDSEYEIKNLFEIVHKVNEKFDINYEEIIKKFINENVDLQINEKYDKLSKMKSYIDNIGLYNILTNGEPNYLDKLKSDLGAIDKDIMSFYLEGKTKFDIQDFVNYIENEMERNNPLVFIYVGDKDMNFDHLGNNVKTIYSKGIYKGIRIVYKNCMYDYSLS